MPDRKQRGAEAQTLVARRFQVNGWPYAESTGAGRNGVDVTGMPGLACEVKATDRSSFHAWLKQAGKSDGVPFVVWRPPGGGPTNLDSWPVMMRLDNFTALLRAAGYGDPQ